MTGPGNYYKTDDEIIALVRGFEDCTIPDSEFNHPAHLTVALSYLHHLRLTVAETAERMRAGLYRFLDHHGADRQKYNETVTLFWVKLVHRFLKRTAVARPTRDIANEMIESFGDSRIIYGYYSKERLSSEEAREAWVEPDVRPLEY